MIKENFKVEKKEREEFPPIPKDIYQVELLDIEMDEQLTYESKKHPEEPQVKEVVFKCQFTLLEGELRGRNVWDNFVPSYLYIGKKGKNKLYRIVEALLGRDITPLEDAEGISGKMLNDLIGKQCRVAIEPVTKGEKTFDNITEWYKANSQLTALTSEEKDKARVKNKKPAVVEEEEEIDPMNIPF